MLLLRGGRRESRGLVRVRVRVKVRDRVRIRVRARANLVAPAALAAALADRQLEVARVAVCIGSWVRIRV